MTPSVAAVRGASCQQYCAGEEPHQRYQQYQRPAIPAYSGTSGQRHNTSGHGHQQPSAIAKSGTGERGCHQGLCGSQRHQQLAMPADSGLPNPRGRKPSPGRRPRPAPRRGIPSGAPATTAVAAPPRAAPECGPQNTRMERPAGLGAMPTKGKVDSKSPGPPRPMRRRRGGLPEEKGERLHIVEHKEGKIPYHTW